MHIKIKMNTIFGFFLKVQILTNVGLIETATITIQNAVSQHAKSVLLWKHYLQLTIRSTSNETEVINIFKESQKHVPEKVKYSILQTKIKEKYVCIKRCHLMPIP